jgi:chromosome segregation ATPase
MESIDAFVKKLAGLGRAFEVYDTMAGLEARVAELKQEVADLPGERAALRKVREERAAAERARDQAMAEHELVAAATRKLRATKEDLESEVARLRRATHEEQASFAHAAGQTAEARKHINEMVKRLEVPKH